MTRKKTPSLPAVHVGTLLFICALLPAFLFKGPQIEFFAVTQIVLVIWLAWNALHAYGSGISIPRTALALFLTLFWLWLALSLTWSLAPGLSAFNFWWIGSLVLVFWLYTLTPDRGALWSHAAAILLVIGLVLALMGINQVLVLEQQARSFYETRNSHAAFLNLVALPASAYFLRVSAGAAFPRRYPLLLGLVLLTLFFSIFLTASRGASLSLAIGVGLLAALSMRYVPRRALVALLGLLGAAYLTTKFSHGELGEQIGQLMQDSPRWMIWESSWQLLQDSPWQGIGLGLFYLAYPVYRHPQDASGGFFAHNDYLQIWIEAGLPGLLLLLAVLAAAAWLFARALRWKGIQSDQQLELAGLFCGLLAVAGHSVVDFNLYILSIMMVSGLMMGRFHELAVREAGAPFLVLRPARFLGRPAYQAAVILLVLVPFLYFVALGSANSYFDKALGFARNGKLQEADQSLLTAHRLVPGDDRMLIAHADLYRHAISVLPEQDRLGKQALYDKALGFLDEAQDVNPLRALTLLVRARLYLQDPVPEDGNARELAAESFRAALALNPRLFHGRTEYATLLLQAGDKEAALRVMDEGVRHDYYQSPELIPFYSLAARLRREAGREEEAAVLEARARRLEKLAVAGYRLRGQ